MPDMKNRRKNRLQVKKQRKVSEKVTFPYFFYTANQSKSLHNMVLQNSYYFTSKIEIKPQQNTIRCFTVEIILLE